MPPRKKLTPDEEDRIVELKLQRVPVRSIAEQVGCAPLTVQRCWNRYLAQRVKERTSDTQAQVEQILAQLEQNATDSRRMFQRAVKDADSTAATRYLEAERRALAELAKFGVIRDDEPAHSGRISKEQAKSVVDAVWEAAQEIPAEHRDAFLRTAAEKVKGLDD